MAGLTPTKDQILTEAGLIARNLNENLERAQAFKYFLDQYSNAGVQPSLQTVFGLTNEESDSIKGAIADADILRAVAFGAATQGTLLDFRQWWKKINGFGYAP